VRPWSSPLVDEVVAIVHKLLDERDARVAEAKPVPKFPWPTPKALAPFVSREEIEAFWALPPVAR
jgi:hypothetical protein